MTGLKMSTDHAVRRLAGTVVVSSVALSVLVSPGWMVLTAFVGVNLIQSSVAGFCPAESRLRRWRGPAAPMTRPWAPVAGSGESAGSPQDKRG